MEYFRDSKFNSIRHLGAVIFAIGLLWLFWDRYPSNPSKKVNTISVRMDGLVFYIPASWEAPNVPMAFGAPPLSENLGQMRSIRIPEKDISIAQFKAVEIKRYLAIEQNSSHSITFGNWANPPSTGAIEKLATTSPSRDGSWVRSDDAANPEYDHMALVGRRLHVYELKRDRRYVFHCTEDLPNGVSTRFNCLGRVPYTTFHGDRSLQIYLTGVPVDAVDEMFTVANFNRYLLKALEKTSD